MPLDTFSPSSPSSSPQIIMEDSPLTFGPTCSNGTSPVCLGCYKTLKQKKVSNNHREHWSWATSSRIKGFYSICGWLMWRSMIMMIFLTIPTMTAALTTRFSAPSAVGQCAVKNVHKESLTLTWSVNYLGFLLQMLVLWFGRDSRVAKKVESFVQQNS